MTTERILENIEYVRNSILKNKSESLTDIQIDYLNSVIELTYDYIFGNDLFNNDREHFNKVKRIIFDLDREVSRLKKSTELK